LKEFIKYANYQVWWHTPVISILRRQRLGGPWLEASLGKKLARPYLNKVIGRKIAVQGGSWGKK
jgi:hypothetical protein